MFRVALYGFLGGVLVLLVAILVQLFWEQERLTWNFLVRLHSLFPSLYLLDLLPFALASICYLAGRYYSALRLAHSESTQQHALHTEALYDYVRAIRAGKEAEYQPVDGDVLGGALVELQQDLRKSREEEEHRQLDDKLRRWSAEGMAQFGEILRADGDDLEEMAYSVVSSLVKYIQANQCGFYMVEGDEEEGAEKYFRLMACYAYSRRKYSDRRIEWGSGLVGACALERVTMRLDHLPQGYLEITSGLGNATPQNLMLVPLLHEDAVFGVLEIASFRPFEDHVVEFTERVASSVAATLSSKRINIRTTRLLEESQRQAEILVSQEEQMRQNMEELQATQEEAARQSESFISFTNSVNQTMIRAEYDVDGVLLYANVKFLQKLEYNAIDDVRGKHISMFINSKDRAHFDPIWERVSAGGHHFEGDMKLLTRNNKDLWTIATYTCLRDQHDSVERILFLAIDITHDKIKNLDWQSQIDALNRVSFKLEITPLGDVIEVNSKFLETMGYDVDSVLKKPIYQLLPKNEHPQFEKILEGVCAGENFEGTLRALTSQGEERWFRASMATVNDMYGDISKIILIANDITREKLMELETRRQTEQLKQQEEQLRRNEVELSQKLRQAREEVKNQFREIEKVQIRNEKTLEGFLDAIITTDQEGEIEFFNKAAEELFGIERSEVLGQNVRLLFPADVANASPFLQAYLDPSGEKVVGERKEVNIKNLRDEEEISVLMLLSEARIGRKVSYTAFIQNISFDLF